METEKIDKASVKLLKKFEKEIAVLVAIQKEGRPTIEDITAKLKEWNFNIAPKEVETLAENLRRRDLLSVILEPTEEGISIKKYGLNKVKNIPSVPHYKDIVDYEEGKDLLEYLDDTKGVNKGREPDIKDYWEAEITFKVNPGMNVRGFISKPEEGFQGAHYRDSKGNVIFKPIHFRRWLGANLRLVNKPESQSDYLAFTKGSIKLNGLPIGKEETPILVQKVGSGMKLWETLEEGTEISTIANIPRTLFSEQSFNEFLNKVCNRGLVGFGGWGKGNANNLELIRFKLLM